MHSEENSLPCSFDVYLTVYGKSHGMAALETGRFFLLNLNKHAFNKPIQRQGGRC